MPGAPEWPLRTQLRMIRDAGFDGAGVRVADPAFAAEEPASCASMG